MIGSAVSCNDYLEDNESCSCLLPQLYPSRLCLYAIISIISYLFCICWFYLFCICWFYSYMTHLLLFNISINHHNIQRRWHKHCRFFMKDSSHFLYMEQYHISCSTSHQIHHEHDQVSHPCSFVPPSFLDLLSVPTVDAFLRVCRG